VLGNQQLNQCFTLFSACGRPLSILVGSDKILASLVVLYYTDLSWYWITLANQSNSNVCYTHCNWKLLIAFQSRTASMTTLVS
jgi:hypothetical protein